MDLTRNVDKVCISGVALYDSVLGAPALGAVAVEPVTRVEAKLYAKIDTTADDTLIDALITTARQMCEGYVGQLYTNRSVQVVINNSSGSFVLPYGPVTIDPTAADENGDALTLSYKFGHIVSPLGQMQLSYTGGHSTLPAQLKTALLAQFTFLYENRGDSEMTMSPEAKMILAPLRTVL